MAKIEYFVALGEAALNNERERMASIMLMQASDVKSEDMRHVLRTMAERCKGGCGDKNLREMYFNGNDKVGKLIHVTKPSMKLSDVILPDSIVDALRDIAEESSRRSELVSMGFEPSTRLLFGGPPGIGKTMAASVLAAELGWPLFKIKMSEIVESFLGATSARLSALFEALRPHKAVYLFDEFDSIGTGRSLHGGSGEGASSEMVRIVNTLLMELEQSPQGIAICCTNRIAQLDVALARRFDHLIHFEYPDSNTCKRLALKLFGQIPLHECDLDAALAPFFTESGDGAEVAVAQSRLTPGLIRLAVVARRAPTSSKRSLSPQSG
jgi:ATP-dependent 26S proteasome regulatory subunit